LLKLPLKGLNNIYKKLDGGVGKYLGIKHCAFTLVPFVVIIAQRWTDTRLNYLYLVDITSGEILDIQLISIGQDTCGFYKRAWDNTILLSPDITIDIIEIDDKYKFSKPEPFLF
jgi:hypothetical protein